MQNKEYSGLQVEFVSFAKDELATGSIPEGWTNCEVSSIENYTTRLEGMDAQIGSCWYWDWDDDVILNWYGNEKKIV